MKNIQVACSPINERIYMSPPRVLDSCCGSRMMWFDRKNPDVVFGDCRHETITTVDRSHGRADGTRTLRIEPDAVMDFRALPFPDGTFRLVSFDPPHLVRAGPRSWLAAPLFGHRSGRKGMTHWLVFMKSGRRPHIEVEA